MLDQNGPVTHSLLLLDLSDSRWKATLILEPFARGKLKLVQFQEVWDVNHHVGLLLVRVTLCRVSLLHKTDVLDKQPDEFLFGSGFRKFFLLFVVLDVVPDEVEAMHPVGLINFAFSFFVIFEEWIHFQNLLDYAYDSLVAIKLVALLED